MHEFTNQEKKTPHQFKQGKNSFSKPQKVQIFNTNNGYFFNESFSQITLKLYELKGTLVETQQFKKQLFDDENYIKFSNKLQQLLNYQFQLNREAISSLQRQFQQILENQASKKATTSFQQNQSNSSMKITTSKIYVQRSVDDMQQQTFSFFYTSKESKNPVNLLCQGKIFDQQIKMNQNTLSPKVQYIKLDQYSLI
ncbi:unnamed protein product [Paramecium pentaurelia]|uniref:Uncharacterized protein n=1 Tax=Paramecium pentaurelia TaxID=43138 RepID=A0A8S1RYN7_9CILI|nr:unnamed protein product [Paramecium pentaurelia]